MKKFFLLVVGLTAVIISGCATQSIQLGKDLSKSGVTYTEAVDKLLLVTTERVIDFDNAEVKKSRRGTTGLEEMIRAKDEAVLDLILEIEKFRLQTKLLKAYFINLQALSDSPVKNDTGEAVKTLSDSISKLNKSLSGKDKLTDDQKTQISTFSGLVTNSIHAAKVKDALHRDAKVIGENLALQEIQLRNISDILKDRFDSENDLFYKEKIIAPFKNTKQTLGNDWDSDRKQWFKTQFISQQLLTAQEAAKQLRGVWADILQGKPDIDSLNVLITEVNEFVVVVHALNTDKKTD